MGPNVACGCRSYKNDDDIHAVEDRNQIYWSQLSAAAVGDNPSSSFARWADHVGDASVTTSLEHGSQGDLIDSSATATKDSDGRTRDHDMAQRPHPRNTRSRSWGRLQLTPVKHDFHCQM
jgi:hypothetical protein